VIPKLAPNQIEKDNSKHDKIAKTKLNDWNKIKPKKWDEKATTLGCHQKPSSFSLYI
jgi:hypothetical protein